MLTLLCAMQPEADPIINALGLVSVQTPWSENLPPNLWEGRVGTKKVTLVTNGFDPRTNANLIGTTPATLATHTVLNHLNPSMVLVAGAAGGCSKSTQIGEVFAIDKAFHHDRRIPLAEFKEYAHGPESLHVYDSSSLRVATISTGNSLDTLDHELAFFLKHGITVKDMETASIAWTASLYQVPTMAIRSITDFYDHPTPEHQFLENFDLALSNLASEIRKILPALDS